MEKFKGGAMIKVFVLILALFCSCGFADAQVLQSRDIRIPLDFGYELSTKQLADVADWLPLMRKWQKYDQQWLNQIPKGLNGTRVKRKQLPNPPSWLPEFCSSYGHSTEIAKSLQEACKDWDAIYFDPAVTAITAQIQTTRADAEKLTKDSFFSRVHLDGLWTQPQLGNSYRVYGLFGGHISLVGIGRVQFYGPPGVLFMRFRDQLGRVQYRAGYTWGMSVKLKDFHFPGSSAIGKNMTLYIDLAKAWIPGLNVVGDSNTNSIDMAGFSIAPKKRNK